MEILSLLWLGLELLIITETTAINVARNKPATLRSTAFFSDARYAVDEKVSTCAKSSITDRRPWLLVDLKGTFMLSSVKLTGTLKTFAVEVFTQNPVHCAEAVPNLCKNDTTKLMVTCDTPVVGRFLRILEWNLTFYDRLTLCEVETFTDVIDTCEHPKQYPQFTRKRLELNTTANPNEIVPVSDLMECSMKCSQNNTCLAFNYNDGAKQCELVWSPDEADVTEDVSWDYYGNDFC
ncbi:uncharacterized protein LOC121373556 [Gigantopelta aegis]|uniref:uncharacterized protein LOC121373556 n=1 Tax=Gigantopelta aegis TaxID=1735272 RepID=UPI001B889A6C|nr:uncharacterized protein LOC121373556 [Gigantopelta aegis]